MHRITVTLHLEDAGPLEKEVGVFNIQGHAAAAFSRLLAACEILLWKEEKGVTASMKTRQREQWLREAGNNAESN